MESKKILYLFGYSANTWKGLDKLVNFIKHQLEKGAAACFVFMHDGVMGLSKTSRLAEEMKELLTLPATFHALKSDLEARGINPDEIREPIRVIDHETLVDLLIAHSNIVSWL